MLRSVTVGIPPSTTNIPETRSCREDLGPCLVHLNSRRTDIESYATSASKIDWANFVSKVQSCFSCCKGSHDPALAGWRLVNLMTIFPYEAFLNCEIIVKSEPSQCERSRSKKSAAQLMFECLIVWWVRIETWWDMWHACHRSTKKASMMQSWRSRFAAWLHWTLEQHVELRPIV